ncbi:MAG: rhodanese-like domain-containing protein [Deltaproteobacteria bacterium]|nr:rhodanese-like domain-containing protein [Deltaproteobacteria bacterium]
MKTRKLLIIGLFLLLIVTACLQNLASDSNIPKIAKEELRSMLGSPDLIILDVRAKEDWDKSELKIKGAVREDPEKDIHLWSDKYSKNKILVFY